MNYVFKCKPHFQQAIYINTKPVHKEPILLCQRCILAKNYQAILLEEFFLQTQPMLGQYMSQDILDICLNKKVFEDSLEKLKNQIIDTLKNKINLYIQKLRNLFDEQRSRLQSIKTSILHYYQCGSNQPFILDDQLEEQLRFFLLNNKSKNPKQAQINYLYKLLNKTNSTPPGLNIQEMINDFEALLDSFERNIHLSNELDQPDYQIQILSEEQAQNVSIDDFNISRTLILNNYYSSLDNLSDSIEKVVLKLETPIDMIGFGKYQSLRELSITLTKSNMGLMRQILVPNLKKFSLSLKGNQLDQFEQLFLPETITDITLDLSQNNLNENCIYYIGQSIDSLKLEKLSISFNGFSVSQNKIWNSGLIQLCRIIYPQQLKYLHLGVGRCCINDVGLEFGIGKLLQKQRHLDTLILDLYSNQITNLNELAKQFTSIKSVKVNANQNPLVNYSELNPKIFSTYNCEQFFVINKNEK